MRVKLKLNLRYWLVLDARKRYFIYNTFIQRRRLSNSTCDIVVTTTHNKSLCDIMLASGIVEIPRLKPCEQIANSRLVDSRA